MKKIRCAIYTRKSSEDGLDQDFNSLDAQREACAAFIASQKHEGWVLLPEYYGNIRLVKNEMDTLGLRSKNEVMLFLQTCTSKYSDRDFL